MATTISTNDKLKHLVDTDRQALVNIQFADRKAGTYLTVSGAILAFLVGSYSPWDSEIFGSLSLTAVSIFSAYFFTVTSLVCLSCVIWPRGFRKQAVAGYFDPSRIRGFGCGENYYRSYIISDDERMLEEMCELLFHRAETDGKKYSWLIKGITFSYFSWVFAAVAFVVSPVRTSQAEQDGVGGSAALRASP